MKTRCKLLPILILLLTITFLLTGCDSMGGSTTDKNDEAQALQRRVNELEATLQAEREEGYIRESALKGQIKELEERLTLLTGGNTDAGVPDSAAMVFHYTVKDGKATVTKYEGTATLVELPATLDGYPVAAIGERAFEGNTRLAAVVIPEGVTLVDWFAFYGCTALFDITLPASVTTIGHAVFDGCAKPTITCPTGSYAAEYAKSYGIACLEK